MGKVTTDLSILNNEDLILLKNKVIEESDVHTIHLSNVLMDTGATTLCLPQTYIQQLGLTEFRLVAVATAAVVSERHIYPNVKVQLGAREAIVECIELPDGTDPLLGVIPMEMMGIELDLQNQKVKFLPYDTLDTYITIY